MIVVVPRSDAFDREPGKSAHCGIWTTAESEVHENGRPTAEMNLARRHLTDAQKVKIGIALEPDIAA